MSQTPPGHQPRPTVPTTAESLGGGWQFFTSNLGAASILAGAPLVLNAIDDLSGSADSTVSVIPIIGQSLIAILFQLALFRRALDFWNEEHGLAQPPGYVGAAVSTSIKGAIPRLGAWIGWMLVFGLIMFAIWIPYLIVGRNTGSVGLSLAAILATIVAMSVALVYIGFVPTAIADQPGNPFERSIEIVDGSFSAVFTTMLALSALSVGGTAFVNLAARELLTAVPLIGALFRIAFGIVTRSVVVGTMVTMYRSKVAPEASIQFSWD